MSEDDLWREVFRMRLDKFEEQLDKNTQMTCSIKNDTQEIIAAFESAKAASKLAKMVSKPIAWLVGACTSVAGAYAAWHVSKGS